MTSYQPIENYGIIGDLDTVALDGSAGPRTEDALIKAGTSPPRPS